MNDKRRIEKLVKMVAEFQEKLFFEFCNNPITPVIIDNDGYEIGKVLRPNQNTENEFSVYIKNPEGATHTYSLIMAMFDDIDKAYECRHNGIADNSGFIITSDLDDNRKIKIRHKDGKQALTYNSLEDLYNHLVLADKVNEAAKMFL